MRKKGNMVEFFKGLSFFILPLGFGCKRMEFFENRIREFGGILKEGGMQGKEEEEEGTIYVVVEDSVCDDKKKTLSAVEELGLKKRKNVKYVGVKWLSKCLGCKRLIDWRPFEVKCLRDERERSVSSVSGGREVEEKGREEEEEEEEEGKSPEKKQRIENEKYTCSKPSSSSGGETFQKKRIIEELEKLMNAYNVQKDTWRSFSYKKAINAIKMHEKNISTFQEAFSIPGIGEKMALKIMEIIECGKLSKVEEIVDEKTKVLEVFCRIWGVGPSTAEGWYAQGLRSLEDLSARAPLTRQQRIGLELHEELEKRIPREEVVEIGEVIRGEVEGRWGREGGGAVEVEVVGSFRRGRAECGDVDVMIVNGGGRSGSEVLLEVTEGLRGKGYLTHDLITPEDSNDSEESRHKKYFGVFKLFGANRIHRRVDIFVVPKCEYASALVHYTGSALFNRSIKLLAAKKNMTLTENGLYMGTVRKGSEVTCKGELIKTLREEDIFSALGLPYRHPHERDD